MSFSGACLTTTRRLVSPRSSAFEAWDAACKRQSAEVGYDAAEQRHKDLEQQLEETFTKIETAEALTLDGLVVQARALLFRVKDNVLLCTVLDRLTEFAAAASSPAMTGVAPGSDAAIVDLFDQWVAQVRKADSAEAAGADAEAIVGMRELARDLRLNVLQAKARSLQGVMLKAMTCNSGLKLAPLLEQDYAEGVVTLDTICRAVTLNLVVMAGMAGWTGSPARGDAGSYNTWLFYERRLLLIELYGKDEARRMERFTYENAGGSFHFPGAGWENVPQPSTRAERWLDLLGVDWRSDETVDRTQWVDQPVPVVGKVA